MTWPQDDNNQVAPSPVWTLLTEVKAALAGVQASTNFIKDDQTAIRNRLHEISNSLTPLIGLPEQMREIRRDHENFRVRLDAHDAAANRSRGAIWMASFGAGFVGAILGLLAAVGKLFGVHSG